MKKQRLGLFLLTCIAALACTFCTSKKTTSSSEHTDVNSVHLWTTYSNTLVLRDDSSYQASTLTKPTVLSEDSNLNLSISMGKGEIEGAQLIILPTNKVNSFDFEVSDLTCGESIIAKEQISVYQQFYALVEQNNDDSYGAFNYNYIPFGYYPDFLVPLDWAKEYQENYIEANQNQGITIEVETTSLTVPGTYSGTFALILDGERTNVPVSVKVHDVDLSKSYLRVYAASSAYITYSQYDWLLNKYRVHGQFPAMGTTSPEHMLESLDHYWDNPHFNTFEIPNSSPEMFKTYLKYLAQHSTATKNYLTRCSAYLQNMDEPNSYDGPEQASQYTLKFKNVKEQVKSELNLSPTSSVARAIDDLPLLLTVNLYLNEHTASRFDVASCGATFCMSQGPLKNEEIAKEFADASATPIWEYHNSGYPYTGQSYPNIGTSLRYNAWGAMQNDYAGVLFWDLDETRCEVSGGGAEHYRARDYFNDIYSWQKTAGCGCIVVPASKFGHPEDYIASARLRSTRDGVEDHTLLTILKSYYEQHLLSEYDLDSYGFNKNLEWIYSRGFSHNGCYVDGSDDELYGMREAIFSLLELAKSNYHVVNGGVTFVGNNADMVLYAKVDHITVDSARVDGVFIKGNSYRFDIHYNAETTPSIYSSIVFGDNDLNFNFKVFNYGKLISVFDTTDMSNLSRVVSSSPKGRAVPAGTVSYSNKKLIFNISQGSEDELSNIGYSPEFKFKAALFNVNDIFNVEHISYKIRIKYNGTKDYMSVRAFDNAIDAYMGEFDTDFRIDNSTIDLEGYYVANISYDVVFVPQVKVSSICYILSSFHGDNVNKYHGGATVEITDLYYSLYTPGGHK